MRRGRHAFDLCDCFRRLRGRVGTLRTLILAAAVLGLSSIAVHSAVALDDGTQAGDTAGKNSAGKNSAGKNSEGKNGEGKNGAGKKPAEQLIPLDPKGIVQLDRVGKRLLVKTHVVLREGFLEMLACPAQTKEHESILAVAGKAYVIHAGLLALGAKPGAPVRNLPKFEPPTGQPIDIFLQWTDADGKPHRVKAQEWIRYATHRYFIANMNQLPVGVTLPENDETFPLRFFEKFKQLAWFGPMTTQQRDKALALSKDPAFRKAIASFYEQSQSRQLDAGWVFPGSAEYVDPTTGHKVYEAEAGDLICVSNFPDAMLDLAIKSTDKQDEGLLFEAWTERIPPRGTEVLMELVPRWEKAAPK